MATLSLMNAVFLLLLHIIIIGARDTLEYFTKVKYREEPSMDTGELS